MDSAGSRPDSLTLLAGIWSILLVAWLSLQRFDRVWCLVAAFSVCSLFVLPAARRLLPAPTPRLVFGYTAAIAAGCVLFPAAIALTYWAGVAVGLDPRTAGQPLAPGAGDIRSWFAGVVLAPFFEEVAYRGVVFPALRERFGVAAAVVASSLLFAIPHLQVWTVLAAFLVGIVLGLVVHGSSSLVPALGMHAGLNLGCIVCGVPVVRLGLEPHVAALVGIPLLAAATFASGLRPRAALVKA